MAYHQVIDHHSMVFDAHRNQAYEAALKAVITPASVVLDLGAGLGLLGMMAAKMGAKKVYLVDPSPVLIAAQKSAASNQLDAVECIFGGLDDITLPEKVDVIISVFTGNFLLSEDLLPLLFSARRQYLKPDGVLIPSAARMWCAPVAISPFCDRRVFQWKSASKALPQQLDLSAVHEYAVNAMYYDRFNNADIQTFSEPKVLLSLDFNVAEKAECFSLTEFELTDTGTMHGWLGWFDMQLGDTWLCTGPFSKALHWSQALLPLAMPTPVNKGDEITLDLKRPQYGEWSWLSCGKDFSYTQSTFLKTPRKSGAVKASQKRDSESANG